MAATQCSYVLPCFTRKPCITTPTKSIFKLSCIHFTTPLNIPSCATSNPLKLSTPRLSKAASDAVSKENVMASSDHTGNDQFRLTYLEGNSWLWEVDGLNILVDPVLVGNLDFGVPLIYDGAKKYLKNFTLDDLPDIDVILIAQALDDHCHLKTLRPLSQKFPHVRVVATPIAKSMLDPLFNHVTYVEPGEDTTLESSSGSVVKVRATTSPVLGVPWLRANGYLVTSPNAKMTLYYEAHCAYNKNLLEKEEADIVIIPVIKQLLFEFTLVSGQEDAVQVAKLLNAKFIVPMNNGDLDGKGFLANLIQDGGTVELFKEILSKQIPDAKVLEPTPGVPLDISRS